MDNASSITFCINGELYSLYFCEEAEDGDVSIIEDEPMKERLERVFSRNGYPYDEENEAWTVTLEQVDDAFREIWEDVMPDEEYPGAEVVTLSAQDFR